jgi:hypothetical protein
MAGGSPVPFPSKKLQFFHHFCIRLVQIKVLIWGFPKHVCSKKKKGIESHINIEEKKLNLFKHIAINVPTKVFLKEPF